MAAFAWKPEFSVSVSVIDAQHRKLFTLGQNLQDAMRAGRGREILGRCLKELVEYTKQHFAEEESLLARHNYPDLPRHRLQHSQLIKKIVGFEQEFASGNALISIDLMDFIRDWIANHILQSDMQYADFFNKLGVY
jgi:hemerythrin